MPALFESVYLFEQTDMKIINFVKILFTEEGSPWQEGFSVEEKFRPSFTTIYAKI